MDRLPRLDILLYAHDGRGLGHASRTIAIGLALRRLFPELRVVFLSGCKVSQELIGPASLDWIKLPSYETAVIDGISRGIQANSNFPDKELGHLRARLIREIVETLHPRIITADHSSQGKHQELLPALQATHDGNTAWILGLRGIIGDISNNRVELAISLFKKHYHSLLWYGDRAILGSEQPDRIRQLYGIEPIECGYVSRMSEMIKLPFFKRQKSSFAGTISIPWIGEKTALFLRQLSQALKKIGPQYGNWIIFTELDHPRSAELFSPFYELPFCLLEKPGLNYISALLNSRAALIFGGYNSLMDVVSLSLPSLVITRGMEDNEQQIHMDKLLQAGMDMFKILDEECSSETISLALRECLQKQHHRKITFPMDGAEKAARYLASLLPQCKKE